ncbi:hypothetical protein ACQP1P_33305 [Dactylosporangium sp. CA-052675]|uniref:hypothetical protein n=1 Tax=Dactylosporangium sp. CA-052675 TaxID=3239927 RepID=UPI003D90EFF7
MSEHSMTVVRLDDVPVADREQIAAAVQDLLVTRGVIIPNDRRDPLWQPSVWMPGPQSRTIVDHTDWFDAFLHTANNGVDISVERDAYHPVENDEVPRCLRCDAKAPADYTDSYAEWLEAWMSHGQEPSFVCGSCQRSAPVGDWNGRFSVLIGAPAVTFLNWPPISQRHIAELRGALGGRTGIVFSHW